MSTNRITHLVVNTRSLLLEHRTIHVDRLPILALLFVAAVACSSTGNERELRLSADKADLVGSCEAVCDSVPNGIGSCGCDVDCELIGDCCSDKIDLCGSVCDGLGASQECSQLAECKSIINHDGAQVCVPSTLEPEPASECDGLGASLQCEQLANCESIINDDGAQVCVEKTPASECDGLGASLQCELLANCESIINDDGAQVCVEKTPASECDGLGASLQCEQLANCESIINDDGAQVCVEKTP